MVVVVIAVERWLEESATYLDKLKFNVSITSY